MRPPKTFMLSGKVWNITLDDRLDDDDELGNCHGYRCSVSYSKLQDSQQLRDTILHECLHAICYENGLASDFKDTPALISEETVVRRLATSFLHLIRDNPKLVAFWTEK